MKLRDILPPICIVMIACGDHSRGLRSGDLVFQGPGDSEFEIAITEATSSRSARFTHVGIIDISGTDTLVIEATPDKGVTVTPLSEFAAGSHTIVFVNVDDPAAQDAAATARKYIGQPYDWLFMPGNGAIYCSELVQISYVRDDGAPLFAPVPMSFVDESGRIPQFWLDLYVSQGLEVPHATPGSSPNSIFRQCDIYKKTKQR